MLSPTHPGCTASPIKLLQALAASVRVHAQAADERQMVAREVSASRLHSHVATSTSGAPSTDPHHLQPPPPHAAAVGLRHTSSSGSGSGSFGADDVGLQRASSMNLPKPDESGVPATHPDMCILRIRRNHLVEVSTSCCLESASALPPHVCLCILCKTEAARQAPLLASKCVKCGLQTCL